MKTFKPHRKAMSIQLVIGILIVVVTGAMIGVTVYNGNEMLTGPGGDQQINLYK